MVLVMQGQRKSDPGVFGGSLTVNQCKRKIKNGLHINFHSGILPSKSLDWAQTKTSQYWPKISPDLNQEVENGRPSGVLLMMTSWK